MGAAGSQHGTSSRYSTGCRCDPCRAARTTYMRNLRRARAAVRDAVQATGRRYRAHGITHGIAGYTDQKCRCYVCCNAAGNYHRARSAT